MQHPDLRDSQSCFNYLIIYSSFYKGCFRRWKLRIAKLLFGGGLSKSLRWVKYIKMPYYMDRRVTSPTPTS